MSSSFSALSISDHWTSAYFSLQNILFYGFGFQQQSDFPLSPI